MALDPTANSRVECLVAFDDSPAEVNPDGHGPRTVTRSTAKAGDEPSTRRSPRSWSREAREGPIANGESRSEASRSERTVKSQVR